eukprot:EG_transcript_13386
MASYQAAKSFLHIGGDEFTSRDLSASEVQQYSQSPQSPIQSPKMHPILVTFVRHGETAENASGTIQGWTPTDLNDTGFRQARACATWMKQHFSEIRAIITSDLPRARSTAEAVHEAFDFRIPFVVTENLRERRLGIFETKVSKEARAYDPDIAKQYKGPVFYDMIAAKYPETRVESRDEFLARGKAALREVFRLGAQCAAESAKLRGHGEAQPIPHLVVVSHGQIIRIMTSLLLANPHLLPSDPESLEQFYAPSQTIGHLFSWSGDKLSNTALTRIILQVEEPRPSGAPVFFTPPTLLARNVI